MIAAAFTEPGPPEVLSLMTLPDPVPGPGEVRVRIRAAGVQPYDCAVRAGWIPPGITPTLPRIPGNEFAGVVDAIGPDVTATEVGAQVLGFGQLGAYATLLVVPETQVVAKPPEMPWEVAGGFTAGAQTAHIAVETIKVSAGDTLLIHGAAGAVGTMAVQLAVRAGARVIATGRPDNHDHLRSLGAEPVTYGEGLADRVRALSPAGIDAAIDGAGGDALDVSLALVADRARVLTLVDHARAGELGAQVTPATRSAARLASLAALYASGDLRFHLRRVYPLAEAADAHREVETGHGRGKVVLSV